MAASPAPLPPSSRESAGPAPSGWEWHVHADAVAMSVAAAERILRQLRTQRDALVGLATGATPTLTYERLAAQARREPGVCARTRWLKLDEWGGLAMDDPASCEHYLRRLILTPLAVSPERYCGWESRPADPGAECQRVAAWLATHGPIDLLVLGLGANGHLGFNEPAVQLQPRPHVARLSPESLNHSMLGTSRSRVAYGLTLGMVDILGARQILLLVTGPQKARQLQRLVTGGISPQFPASLLRRHAAVAVFCDAAAAALVPPAALPASLSP